MMKVQKVKSKNAKVVSCAT